MRVVLASTSRYRRALLERVLPRFEVADPEVDETARPGETGATLSERLALAKADVIAQRDPHALVIGSDQVAVTADGSLLGKPGSRPAAHAQLSRCSGSTVRFETAVAAVREGTRRVRRVATTVRFRALSERDIEAYLAREPALDAAGSFKSEGLGIALFEAVESMDPTALVGLPLIATCALLREFGVEPLHTDAV